MKKALFILSTILLVGILSSCDKNEDLTVKKDWIFTITVVSTTDDIVSEPIVTTQEFNDLTKTEAEAEAKAMEIAGTTTQTLMGITMSIKTTVTIAEKE